DLDAPVGDQVTGRDSPHPSDRVDQDQEHDRRRAVPGRREALAGHAEHDPDRDGDEREQRPLHVEEQHGLPARVALPHRRLAVVPAHAGKSTGAQPPGVTRYASKTASMLRSAVRRLRSSFTSPTSTVYQLRAIWSATWPPYSTMFAPCSAKVRATSSSRRGRSHDWRAIVTRNELVAVSSSSQCTGVNRSGVRRSA